MIARLARFAFPTVHHREEAERNGSERVGPSLARQPGFRAIYYGRSADLEAVSISIFDDLESAGAAATAMNAEPLLSGQASEMLPTPTSVEFFTVASSVVRDAVPTAGQLVHLVVADGIDHVGAARWATGSFAPMLERLPGLCQAYFLAATDNDGGVAMTFWDGPTAMADGTAAIVRWQQAEALAGRPPAFRGRETEELSALLLNVAGVTSSMPVVR